MKPIKIFLICVLILFGSAAFSASADDAFAIFSKGMDFENQLLIFEARNEFRVAVAIDSDNAGYLEHYAWFLTAHGFNE